MPLRVGCCVPGSATVRPRKRMRSVLIPTLWLISTAAYPAESTPITDFRYEPRLDDACLATNGWPVKPEWSRELRDRIPDFRDMWESVGPPMAKAVNEITNKPFLLPRTVNLTLCNKPSNSFFGVTVNMRYALRSFTATPVSLRYKVDTAFHEALHEFVARHTPRESGLLERHKSESFCVRNHLHLLALQKAVLLSLNDFGALDQVVANDSQLPSGCYKQAWQLLNSSPSTYQEYLAELSQ